MKKAVTKFLILMPVALAISACSPGWSTARDQVTSVVQPTYHDIHCPVVNQPFRCSLDHEPMVPSADSILVQ